MVVLPSERRLSVSCRSSCRFDRRCVCIAVPALAIFRFLVDFSFFSCLVASILRLKIPRPALDGELFQGFSLTTSVAKLTRSCISLFRPCRPSEFFCVFFKSYPLPEISRQRCTFCYVVLWLFLGLSVRNRSVFRVSSGTTQHKKNVHFLGLCSAR